MASLAAVVLKEKFFLTLITMGLMMGAWALTAVSPALGIQFGVLISGLAGALVAFCGAQVASSYFYESARVQSGSRASVGNTVERVEQPPVENG